MQLKEELIPLENFFRNPERTNYMISPYGKYISFLAPYEDRLNVHLYERENPGTLSRLTQVLDRSIEAYGWAGESHIWYLRDFGGDENHHLFSVDVASGVEKDLTPHEGVKVVLMDQRTENESEVLISMNRRNPALFDVYSVNIATGEVEMRAENPGNVLDWTCDHKGKVRLALKSDGANTEVLYREKEEDAFESIMSHDFRTSFTSLFFTFDNQNIYALSNVGRDKSAVVIYDPRKKEEIEEVYAHPLVDVARLRMSRKRKCLTVAYSLVDKTEPHYFDDFTRELTEKIAKDDPSMQFYLVSNSEEEDYYIVRSFSDRNLGTYYLFDVAKDKLEKLAEISPWLDDAQMAEMQPISYEARDGLRIQGYLTLPVDYQEGQKLATVIHPHGGPWFRDEWGFNPELQFLANRGYAVLQMNFRGSTGFGRAFWEASFGEWGGKMQDDITDGVKYLIGRGIADPDRVAIYGGSYGGYAALAGMTFTPELYACGVAFVGVSNIFTFLETIPPYWEPYLEVMYEMIGHPEKDKERLRAKSPVFHVDKVQAPLFVVQGAKDPRVKKSESDQIVAAMRERGITVDYMVKENEGHGFKNQENKFEFYQAFEKFLQKHLA